MGWRERNREKGFGGRKTRNSGGEKLLYLLQVHAGPPLVKIANSQHGLVYGS